MVGMVLQSSFSKLISGRLRRKLREVLPFSDLYESNSCCRLSIKVKFKIRQINKMLLQRLYMKQSPKWWTGQHASRQKPILIYSFNSDMNHRVALLDHYEPVLLGNEHQIQIWKQFRCLQHNSTKKLLVNTIWFSLHQELFILSRDWITCDSRTVRWEWGGIWIHFLGWYEVHKSSRSS